MGQWAQISFHWWVWVSCVYSALLQSCTTFLSYPVIWCDSNDSPLNNKNKTPSLWSHKIVDILSKSHLWPIFKHSTHTSALQVKWIIIYHCSKEKRRLMERKWGNSCMQTFVWRWHFCEGNPLGDQMYTIMCDQYTCIHLALYACTLYIHAK